MKRRLTSLLAFSSCLLLPAMPVASAAPGSPAPVPDGQRYLFIVDTSSGMERLKAENETTMYELLRSGLFGQMQTGDTYGLWTFDKETHAGKFPLQTYDARRASQLAAIAAAYLSGHNYENSDDVKRMTELLLTVVRAVSNVNVFVISDGSSAMHGTPFDKAINTEYRKQRRQRSSAKQPFVTTLIARDGSITNYSVVVAGKPILLPERPAPTVAATKPPPSSRQAGILLSNTIVTSATVPLSSVTPPVSQSAPVQAPTNIATISRPSPNPDVKATIPTTSVIQIGTKSNNVSNAAEPSASEPAKTDVALVSAGTQTNNTIPELSTPAPAPPTPAGASPPIGVATSPAVERPAPSTAIASILPAPITVAARELHPEPGTANQAPPTAVQAAALPMPSGPGAGLFLTFGSLLMAAALFLLFVVFRRLRPAPGGSLITQSMERR
jgi:hypothetical protein